MPYILKVDRERFEPTSRPATPGELNYAVTRLAQSFIGPEPTYTAINAAIGALECAKLELYRRLAAPYEDDKMKQNGDCYT
jgi:hypothetical protein